MPSLRIELRSLCYTLLLSGILIIPESEALSNPIGSTNGSQEIVFSHAQAACDQSDIPDAPTRVFLDSHGFVHLIAAHVKNYFFLGRDFDTLKRNCDSAYSGAADIDPSHFNNRSWLTAFWTTNGNDILALVHNEYHGVPGTSSCPTGNPVQCWYNSIMVTVSHDGGRHFTRPQESLVAVPRTKFDPAIHTPIGYFGPSNIVARDGFYYVMIWAEADGKQARGECLLRTATIWQASSWRAWDGVGFNSKLSDNPYTRMDDQSTVNVCQPIEPSKLIGHVTSLVWSEVAENYIAVMAPDTPSHFDFVMSTSRDLIHWSELQEILGTSDEKLSCPGLPTYAYPSLVDPSSKSLVFSDIGTSPYLYFTRFNRVNCKLGLNRDLLRRRVDLGDRFAIHKP